MTDSRITQDEDSILLDASDDDFMTQLMSALGGAEADPFDAFDEVEKRVTTVGVGEDNIPVRITIEYPAGHAYEAAQAQGGLGAPLNLAAFVLAFEDDSITSLLDAAGVSIDEAYEVYFRLAVDDSELDAVDSPNSPEYYNPLTVFASATVSEN